MYIKDGEWWTVKGAYHDEHYTRSKRIDGKGQMTEGEVEQLRYICKRNIWAEDTQKRVLSFVKYDIKVEILGVEEPFSFSVPSKIGFSGSFDK